MVRLEVVRGLANPRLRQAVEGFMDVMRYVPLDNRLWQEATELAWSLDRHGVVMPSPDILIACCALRIEAAVLTWDKHFLNIPNIRVLNSLDRLGS